jgi:hypothetical protein
MGKLETPGASIHFFDAHYKKRKDIMKERKERRDGDRDRDRDRVKEKERERVKEGKWERGRS